MQSANLEEIEITTTELAPDFPAASHGLWHVLRTRSRQEKALSADLQAMAISHFLPVVCVERHYGRQRVSVSVPLFPGYLFLRGSLDHAYIADRTHRVAQIIRVTDQARLDWELRNLAKVLSAGMTLDPYPHLQRGVRVEVRSGPLRGVQGLIQERSQRDRLILQVDMLGQAVSLEVDAAMLDVID